jgi:hypothetical protein
MTGDVLWQFQTGAGADAPVSTYEVDGEQYVAILAGGNQYMGTASGDNLWAFKLGGTVKPAAAPRPPGPMPLPTERTEITLDAATLTAYAGAYEFQPGLAITISVENGQLAVALPGQNSQKTPLSAESATVFFAKSVNNLEVRFTKDEQGVVRLLFRQGGVELRATRK